MKIIRSSICGTLESSDIYVTVRPNPGKGIEVYLKSVVEKQYGEVIRNTIRQTLFNLGVEEALVEANDKGALDYAIIARVECAVKRAAGLSQSIIQEAEV